MKSSVVLGLSGFVLAAAGMAGTFVPHEILRYAGIEPAGMLPVLVQLYVATLLGLGVMNWMAKGNLVGGIYARPLVMGNLLHFVVGALALMKTLTAGAPAAMIAATIVYAVFAAGFGVFLFASPVQPAR